MKRRWISLGQIMVSAIFILSLLSMFGCSSQPTTSTTSVPLSTSAQITSVPTNASVPTTTLVPATAATPEATETLKIGVVCWNGWSTGLDQVYTTQVMAEMDNSKGGIDIGGKKYKVELIVYDSNNTQATEVAAINRLIYQDKVNYIIGDGLYATSWLQAADDNKVVNCLLKTSELNLDPKWRYTVCPIGANIGLPVNIARFCKKYPDLVKKGFVLGLPDNGGGHYLEMLLGTPATIMGAKMEYIYYPPTQTDLSALGTKVKSMNPGVYLSAGGGEVADSLALMAAWQAGYRGQYFSITSSPIGTLLKVLSSDAVEGLIAGASTAEFDPPLTNLAKEFKEAWIAKNGLWEDPGLTGLGCYACIIAGLQKAGTINTDQVISTIQNGLTFSSPVGDYLMIARPDLGNNRTIDSCVTYYSKTINNGKPVLIDTMTPAEEASIWQELQAAESTMTPPK